ncbi:MAG: SDR family NAD(P)-dependent oxidoreductase [Alphaproteobacteria bacterium]|nr:SDR family NAD(P)-dependent oxidoreductase [Alphaproteobacteria bacterium]
MSGETWVVLGATSAIARAFARIVAARGDGVILAGRDREDLAALAQDLRVRGAGWAEALGFDALDTASHGEFARECGRRATGKLCVFLAFAAMPEQDAIDKDPSLAVHTINATFTGAVSVLHCLAPMLDDQHGGRVIALGSVAGDRGRRKNYVYGAAKAGLHTYLQGLRARLFAAGATVTTVKPGFVDTAMTFGRPGLFLVAAPEAVAAAALAAAEKGREEIYAPFFWAFIMLIIKSIPERIMKKLNI